MDVHDVRAERFQLRPQCSRGDERGGQATVVIGKLRNRYTYAVQLAELVSRDKHADILAAVACRLQRQYIPEIRSDAALNSFCDVEDPDTTHGTTCPITSRSVRTAPETFGRRLSNGTVWLAHAPSLSWCHAAV